MWPQNVQRGTPVEEPKLHIVYHKHQLPLRLFTVESHIARPLTHQPPTGLVNFYKKKRDNKTLEIVRQLLIKLYFENLCRLAGVLFT